MPRSIAKAVAATLLLIGGAASSLANVPPASSWEIGPFIRGADYSAGMPVQPEPARNGGWFFDFPYPDVSAGHVHYLSLPEDSLVGASKIVMRYRIDAAPGARFVPRENPEMPGTVSFYFQRSGDSWSGSRHPFHRWYAPSVDVIAPGVHEMSVSLSDPRWVSVMGKPASAFPEAFEDALANTEKVGFVFGSAIARGHGVYATGPARFTLLSFEVR